MVDLIMTPESEMQQEDRTWVAEETYRNFANHINKGFLEYRKSVTETDDFALTDWCGRGSILRDVMGREYIDMLGGFGLYSPGIRHPKIVAAVKAQLDRTGLSELFDRVQSVDAVRSYKPAAAPYRYAAEQMGAEPDELWMVACHDWDLAGARACGMATAFIARPAMSYALNYRPADITADDFTQLADQLAARFG